MTYKSSNSMPSHSTRRTSTRARPSLSSPSSSAPPSNYSSSTQHVPSTRDYITSSPAFEINQTVNITVEISSSSTPAYNGYDVRNYAPPVTTTCYSTEPSSSSASTSSYQYSIYESISNFPDYSFNPPSRADTTTSSSSSPSSPPPPLQEYTPSASSAASANYSYCASEGYTSEHYGSQSEYLGSQPQGQWLCLSFSEDLY